MAKVVTILFLHDLYEYAYAQC